MLHLRRNRAALLIATAMLVACANRVPPVARPRASTRVAPRTESLAVAMDNNVQVAVHTGRWGGVTKIGQAATPLRLVIQNGGRWGVRLRYEDFELLASDGTQFAALPPLSSEDDASAATVVHRPRFVFRAFEVAGHLRSSYPSLIPWPGTFSRNSSYHERCRRLWRRVAGFPTYEMIERAIPEGVLQPGGRLDGYMYFEHVPLDAEPTRLLAKFSRADTERLSASVSIPFDLVE